MALAYQILEERFVHFKVDAESIAVAALSQLAQAEMISKRAVKKAIKKYQINDVTAAEAGNTEGSGWIVDQV